MRMKEVLNATKPLALRVLSVLQWVWLRLRAFYSRSPRLSYWVTLTALVCLVLSSRGFGSGFLTLLAGVAFYKVGWVWLNPTLRASKRVDRRVRQIRKALAPAYGVERWKDVLGVWRVDAYKDIDGGQRYEVAFKTPAGKTDADILKLMPMVRDQIGAFAWTEDMEKFRSGMTYVLFTDKDYLSDTITETPLLGDSYLPCPFKEDYAARVPLGADVFGRTMYMDLFTPGRGGTNWLVQGDTGAGKLSISKAVVDYCLKFPDLFDLVIFDGKGNEFRHYEEYALMYGTTNADFFEQQRYITKRIAEHSELVAEHSADGRYREHEFFNPWDDGGKFLVVIEDERMRVLSTLKMKELDDFFNTEYANYSVSRSMGVAAVKSSQIFKTTSPEVITAGTRNQCFAGLISGKVSRVSDSLLSGFTAEDEVAPHKIKGVMTEKGLSSAGLMVIAGVQENTFFKSVYLQRDKEISYLKSLADR